MAADLTVAALFEAPMNPPADTRRSPETCDEKPVSAGRTTHVVALPDGYSPDNRRTLFQCGANARLHRMVRARITKQIRADVAAIARIGRVPRFDVPVTITAVQHPGKGKRALDAENVAPLVKACIDGLRDAGVLLNDSPRHVRSVTFTTGDRSLYGRLVLHITPAGGKA